MRTERKARKGQPSLEAFLNGNIQTQSVTTDLLRDFWSSNPLEKARTGIGEGSTVVLIVLSPRWEIIKREIVYRRRQSASGICCGCYLIGVDGQVAVRRQILTHILIQIQKKSAISVYIVIGRLLKTGSFNPCQFTRGGIDFFPCVKCPPLMAISINLL